MAWAVALFSVGVLALYPVLFGFFAALRLRGRTVLDATGLTVGLRHIPWSDISLVRFSGAGPMRWVQVVRHRGDSSVALGLVDQPLRDPRYPARIAEVEAAGAGRVRAARRRTSPLVPLIVAAFLPTVFVALQFVTVDRPWLDRPWWPGVDVTTETPDPCAVLSTVEARRLVPAGRPEKGYGDPDDPSRLCRSGRGAPKLEVELARASYGDLIAESDDDFDRASRLHTDTEPVPGLGDEAFTGTYGASVVRVVARRGNVVVEVRFTPGDEGADRGTPAYAANRAAVVELTRRVVDTVELR